LCLTPCLRITFEILGAPYSTYWPGSRYLAVASKLDTPRTRNCQSPLRSYSNNDLTCTATTKAFHLLRFVFHAAVSGRYGQNDGQVGTPKQPPEIVPPIIGRAASTTTTGTEAVNGCVSIHWPSNPRERFRPTSDLASCQVPV
jgi:hypothetical protein